MAKINNIALQDMEEDFPYDCLDDGWEDLEPDFVELLEENSLYKEALSEIMTAVNDFLNDVNTREPQDGIYSIATALKSLTSTFENVERLLE